MTAFIPYQKDVIASALTFMQKVLARLLAVLSGFVVLLSLQAYARQIL
jgi:hypothetical protein